MATKTKTSRTRATLTREHGKHKSSHGMMAVGTLAVLAVVFVILRRGKSAAPASSGISNDTPVVTAAPGGGLTTDASAPIGLSDLQHALDPFSQQLDYLGNYVGSLQAQLDQIAAGPTPSPVTPPAGGDPSGPPTITNPIDEFPGDGGDHLVSHPIIVVGGTTPATPAPIPDARTAEIWQATGANPASPAYDANAARVWAETGGNPNSPLFDANAARVWQAQQDANTARELQERQNAAAVWQATGGNPNSPLFDANAARVWQEQQNAKQAA